MLFARQRPILPCPARTGWLLSLLIAWVPMPVALQGAGGDVPTGFIRSLILFSGSRS